METINMFEQASRLKLRFKASNGLISTEDLWDLPLSQLDVIAKGLRKELREADDSFIEESKTDVKLELRFEIVKYVITTKIAERDARAAQRDKAARRQQLLEALEGKKAESLKNMSVEDIEKELKALDA